MLQTWLALHCATPQHSAVELQAPPETVQVTSVLHFPPLQMFPEQHSFPPPPQLALVGRQSLNWSEFEGESEVVVEPWGGLSPPPGDEQDVKRMSPVDSMKLSERTNRTLLFAREFMIGSYLHALQKV